jgi:esterase
LAPERSRTVLAHTEHVVGRELTLNGLRFHFLEWGEESAAPVVLLHGFTGHARGWEHTAEVRGEDY